MWPASPGQMPDGGHLNAHADAWSVSSQAHDDRWLQLSAHILRQRKTESNWQSKAVKETPGRDTCSGHMPTGKESGGRGTHTSAVRQSQAWQPGQGQEAPGSLAGPSVSPEMRRPRHRAGWREGAEKGAESQQAKGEARTSPAMVPEEHVEKKEAN